LIFEDMIRCYRLDNL